ncbi:MAG: hypothetical protein LBJ31_01510 [Treponema sp.]|jgi:hypothetical protein|nr:hypothetical protein [Treponema sp.]
MKFKLTSKLLLSIVGSLGGLLILYALATEFLHMPHLPEKIEKWFMDGIILAALAVFMYNRKLYRDEKAKKAAEAEAEQNNETAAEEEPEPGDENRPHWER